MIGSCSLRCCNAFHEVVQHLYATVDRVQERLQERLQERYKNGYKNGYNSQEETTVGNHLVQRRMTV
jgi:hypothetical protein